MTFQKKKKDDKEMLLSSKRKIPPGIYVIEEFPLEIKKDMQQTQAYSETGQEYPRAKR